MSVILVLGRLRQEDQKFKVSFSYIASLEPAYLKITKLKRKEGREVEEGHVGGCNRTEKRGERINRERKGEGAENRES